MEKNTKIALVGMSIIVGMMSYVIGSHTSFEDDLEKLKPTARDTRLQLSIYNKSANGSLTPMNDNGAAGDNLAFKISSSLPVHIAFLVSVNHKTPKIVLKNARLPPGKNKSLDSDGSQFIYPITEKQQSLKFCIIHSDNAKELRKNLLELGKLWPLIPDAQCVLVTVPSS